MRERNEAMTNRDRHPRGMGNYFSSIENAEGAAHDRKGLIGSSEIGEASLGTNLDCQANGSGKRPRRRLRRLTSPYFLCRQI